MLAFIVAGLVILALLSWGALLAATAMGIGFHNGFSQGIWPTLIVLPEFAFPLAFILLIILIAITWANKARANNTVNK